MPLCRKSSSCVPASTIRPLSTTRILSALRMVDSRWAMTKVVRSCMTFGQGRLDQALGLGVQGRGRFVEDEDGRVLEQGPGDGQPLALAARKLPPRSPMGVS